MITRIELNGFKTFQDFSMDFAPFQVNIGPNGAGKSNLFDALRLLSRLADTSLAEAFQELGSRGTPLECFTILPNGRSTGCMQLAVELLVNGRTSDTLGQETELENRRFRYELHLCRYNVAQSLSRVRIMHESLESISAAQDSWLGRHDPDINGKTVSVKQIASHREFISTDMAMTTNENGEESLVEFGDLLLELTSRDGKSVRIALAKTLGRTLLSTVGSTEHPDAFAVREEMRSWRFLLQLNPEKLRQPSPILGVSTISSDGQGLSAALARMQATDPYLLTDVSRDMTNLVSGIAQIEVTEDEGSGEYRLRSHMIDGRIFPARLLSDGTLRLLALVALRNDPEHQGVLCVEEPENGVPPFRLKDMVWLLHGLASDLSDPERPQDTLRQVIINTHSPALIGHLVPELLAKATTNTALAFMDTVTRVSPDSAGSMRVTRATPVTTNPDLLHELDIDDAEAAYTLAQVRDYLKSVNASQAVALLQNGAAH